jgi:3-oxoacyl-[acyl-carrier-protein] synthase III
MLESKIRAISYYLPENILKNEEISSNFPDWSAEKISAKTGIYERRVAGENETACDLAKKAALKLFKEYTVNTSEIDFLLLCTQSPDYFLPTTACILHDELGLNNSCGALDFNLGCSGYIYGLSLAKGLISSSAAKNILLITSETYSKHIHESDKGNLTIFGDGAAATLISANIGNGLISNFQFGTDGSGAKNLIVKNGGFRNPILCGKDLFNESEFIKNDDFLYMNGQEIFSFTTKSVPILVKNTLEVNSMDIESVDLFIFHQANKFMLNYIRRKLNIPKNKFYIFMENCGNTVSSTIPIALKEAELEGKIQPGMKVLLVGFGVGYSYGATIVNY